MNFFQNLIIHSDTYQDTNMSCEIIGIFQLFADPGISLRLFPVEKETESIYSGFLAAVTKDFYLSRTILINIPLAHTARVVAGMLYKV